MEIKYKGLSVHYQILGHGKPFLLLHGFNESIEIFNPIIKLLSNEYQLILIDLPGFGKSHLPNVLSMTYMAEAVYSVLKSLNIDKINTLGHSMGAYVLLELANKKPNLFNNLIFLHSTAASDNNAKKSNRLKTIEFLNHNPIEPFFNIFIPGLLGIKKHPKWLHELEKIIFQTHKQASIAALHAMLNRTDYLEWLKDTNIPIAFIAGTHDELLPPNELAKQAASCKNGYFKNIEHCGHLSMWETPDTLCQLIVNYLKYF